MARLIDADRLYDQVEARYRQSSGEEHRTERSLLDAICDSPTIPAIPLEWMREKIKEHTGEEGWQDYLANSFGLCIEEWQKEQEAQDVWPKTT